MEIQLVQDDLPSPPSGDETAHDVELAVRPEHTGHWIFLLLSVTVLLLAGLLKTRGESQVVLPVFNVPLPPTCTAQRVLGIDCPGCGLTRCFISLAHGELRRAWHFNPAGFFFFALVVLQVPYRAVQLWRGYRGREPVRLRRPYVLLWLVAIALIGQWFVKLVVQAVSFLTA